MRLRVRAELEKRRRLQQLRAEREAVATQSPDADKSALLPIRDELINPDACAWIEQHFYVPELRGPIMLADYQRQALHEALAKDGDSLRYSTILWSDIKKSIKSCIAAGVLLWSAFQVDSQTGWGSFYVIANDLKQADSRVSYYLRRAIQLNPLLREACHVRAGSYKIMLPNQTFIESIPIDPTGEAGSNADGMVFSELWGAHGKAMNQMWAEMTLSPTKFGKSFRWIESYAGYRDTSTLLLGLYEQATKAGKRLDGDIEIFANSQARLFALWNTQPRLSWQTPDYYRQERAALSVMPEEFNRIHRNQWADGGTERFLSSITLWDACEQEVPKLDGHTPVVLAMDAGESNDTFGTALISRHWSDDSLLAVRYALPYVPVNGEPLDFDKIEKDIRGLCQRYAVQLIAYDPMLLGQMMRRLTTGKNPINTPCEKFNQGTARLEADKGLLDLITQRRLVHGDDKELRQHIDNADRRTDPESRKLRIVKRRESLKIDLAVCLSMGCARAFEVLFKGKHQRPATGGARISVVNFRKGILG